MTVGSISAAGLGQQVLASSDSNRLQQTLQTLQSSITSGDLNGAQATFETLQTVNQSLATASGTRLASNSQLSTDLTALDSALGSGNLSTAWSAFVKIQSDLKNGISPSLTNEANVASQSVQLVQELLSTLNLSNSSSISDSTTSVLERVYGTSSGLNVLA